MLRAMHTRILMQASMPEKRDFCAGETPGIRGAGPPASPGAASRRAVTLSNGA